MIVALHLTVSSVMLLSGFTSPGTKMNTAGDLRYAGGEIAVQIGDSVVDGTISMIKGTKQVSQSVQTAGDVWKTEAVRIEEMIRAEEERAAEEARRAAEAAKKAANADKKSGKNASASAGEVRKSQTKGGYAMTKDELELSNSFSQNKGRLPMPLSGKYMIVGHFGQQQHQELKYVQVNSSGIDIQTTPGTTARSVFNGVVTRVFVMPGYNSSVIIRHGNYLTIYSNLSEVFVKAGDKVTTRQSIGRIYSDPEENNRTVLHFQLWKETTKLNPEPWLNK